MVVRQLRSGESSSCCTSMLAVFFSFRNAEARPTFGVPLAVPRRPPLAPRLRRPARLRCRSSLAAAAAGARPPRSCCLLRCRCGHHRRGHRPCRRAGLLLSCGHCPQAARARRPTRPRTGPRTATTLPQRGHRRRPPPLRRCHRIWDRQPPLRRPRPRRSRCLSAPGRRRHHQRPEVPPSTHCASAGEPPSPRRARPPRGRR